MAKVVFDSERCKACGLCVEACPKKNPGSERRVDQQKGLQPSILHRPGKMHRMCHVRHHVSRLRHRSLQVGGLKNGGKNF